MTFVLSAPPASTPSTSASGRPIKAKVIRAMEEQLAAENEASGALDALIAVLRRSAGLPTPIPARGEK